MSHCLSVHVVTSMDLLIYIINIGKLHQIKMVENFIQWLGVHIIKLLYNGDVSMVTDVCTNNIHVRIHSTTHYVTIQLRNSTSITVECNVHLF